MDRQELRQVDSQVKVLVVDDSAFMRQVIIKMLEADPTIKVVGYARDGQEALEKIQRFKPDVVTMDVEMPGLDGLETLEKIMCVQPTPVLMLSAVTTEGAKTTIRALELGAVDFVAKPAKRIEMVQLASELPEKVKMAASVAVSKFCRAKRYETFPTPPLVFPPPKKIRQRKIEVVAIGTSTGGPAALNTLFRALPKTLPAGVLIVQHMPPGFTASLAQRLNDLGNMPVKEAEDGDLILPGQALLAPAGWQMEAVRESSVAKVRLSKESPIKTLFKPSVDVLFLSIAEVFGGNSIGVVMTGMGNDGTRGLRAMKEKNAIGLAEDESTCIVYGMPRSVTEAGLVDKTVPLPNLAREIVNIVSG